MNIKSVCKWNKDNDMKKKRLYNLDNRMITKIHKNKKYAEYKLIFIVNIQIYKYI